MEGQTQMRLIDAEKMNYNYQELCKGISCMSCPFLNCESNKCELESMIWQQPPIDAEPTKHGHWVNNRNMYIEWATCSQCGAEWNKYENEFFRFNFCPNCGVKMDEGEEEE